MFSFLYVDILFWKNTFCSCTWPGTRCQSSRWISHVWTAELVSPPSPHLPVQSGPMSSPWRILGYVLGPAELPLLVESNSPPLVWPHALLVAHVGGHTQDGMCTPGPPGPPEPTWDGWGPWPPHGLSGLVSVTPPGGTHATICTNKGNPPPTMPHSHLYIWVPVIGLFLHGEREAEVETFWLLLLAGSGPDTMTTPLNHLKQQLYIKIKHISCKQDIKLNNNKIRVTFSMVWSRGSLWSKEKACSFWASLLSFCQLSQGPSSVGPSDPGSGPLWGGDLSLLFFLLFVFLWAFLWTVGWVCVGGGGVCSCTKGVILSSTHFPIGPDSLSWRTSSVTRWQFPS